jgi:hypothetical protein
MGVPVAVGVILIGVTVRVGVTMVGVTVAVGAVVAVGTSVAVIVPVGETGSVVVTGATGGIVVPGGVTEGMVWPIGPPVAGMVAGVVESATPGGVGVTPKRGGTSMRNPPSARCCTVHPTAKKSSKAKQTRTVRFMA